MNDTLRRWTGPIVAAVLVAVAWLAIALTSAPAPRAGAVPDTGFSTDRAWAHIEAIARAPHPPGTAEHDRVRAHLIATLEGLGLQVDTQTTPFHGRYGATVRGALTRNLAARIPGTSSTGAVLLLSHYDAVPLARGAGDDGIGVAATLETTRALLADGPHRNDVIVLITDAEELGLLGARAFAAGHPWMDDVAFVLNFEARGTSGPAVMFETGPGSGWAIRELGRVGHRPISGSVFPEAYARLPNDTDFTIFRARGLPGLNFAIGESAQWYHTPGDRPENLSRASVDHMGRNALAMARATANADLATAADRASERIYFHVPMVGLVGYGAGAVVPLAILSILIFLAIAIITARRGRLSVWGAPVGFVAAIVALAITAALAWGLWAAVRGSHPELGGIVGKAIHHESPYARAVAGLAVAVVGGVFGLLRRWLPLEGLAMGAILVPLLLSAVAAFTLPAASYVFLWPALLSILMVGALVAAAPPRAVANVANVAAVPTAPIAATLAVVVLAAGVLLILAPVAHLVLVFLNISTAPLLAIVMALVVLLLLPALDLLGRPNRWWLPAAGAAAAAAFTIAGLAGAGPTPGRPAPSNVLHVQDVDTGEALWATPADHRDAFTARFVGDDADTVSLARFSAWLAAGRYRVAEAPAPDAPAADVEVLGDEVAGQPGGQRRVVRLRLSWPGTSDPPITVEVRPAGNATRLLAPEGARHPRATATDTVTAAPPAGRWLLVHGGTTWPLELTVDAPAGEEIGLVVTTRHLGLPDLPAGPAPTRPADRMAVPAYRGRSTITDARVVRRTVALPAPARPDATVTAAPGERP